MHAAAYEVPTYRRYIWSCTSSNALSWSEGKYFYDFLSHCV